MFPNATAPLEEQTRAERVPVRFPSAQHERESQRDENDRPGEQRPDSDGSSEVTREGAAPACPIDEPDDDSKAQPEKQERDPEVVRDEPQRETEHHRVLEDDQLRSCLEERLRLGSDGAQSAKPGFQIEEHRHQQQSDEGGGYLGRLSSKASGIGLNVPSIGRSRLPTH